MIHIKAVKEKSHRVTHGSAAETPESERPATEPKLLGTYSVSILVASRWWRARKLGRNLLVRGWPLRERLYATARDRQLRRPRAQSGKAAKSGTGNPRFGQDRLGSNTPVLVEPNKDDHG